MDRATITKNFVYLDRLRASSRTNMFNAPSYLAAERGLNYDDARRLWLLWMHAIRETGLRPDKSTLEARIDHAVEEDKTLVLQPTRGGVN